MPTRTMTFAVALLFAIGVARTGSAVDPATNAPPGMLAWSEVTASEIPASPELLAQGRQAYEIRCAACHGLQGNGHGPAALWLRTPPRDFTRLSFKLHTTTEFPTDLDLFRSITVGFQAYGMPSFQYLSETQRWALVHYVKQLARDGWLAERRQAEGQSFNPQQAESIVAERMTTGELVAVGAEPAADADTLARGKAAYAKVCQSCHGLTGRGDGPSAATLTDSLGNPISARAFRDANVFRKGGWRRADTVRVLQAGMPGTPMPSFLDSLPDNTAWDVARYVEHLRQQDAN